MGELNEIEATKQTWRICGFVVALWICGLDDDIYCNLFMVVLHLNENGM